MQKKLRCVFYTMQSEDKIDIPYVRKYGVGKFGKFDEWCSIHQFFVTNVYKYDEITEDCSRFAQNFW